MNCGQAAIRLLEAYGVDTVFGIPGVHTLDFCRGLNDSGITHVQARNEQGAGFMADGYARVSGKPGVALVISGPGVTNALTAVGQAYADSIPLLLISSDAPSYTLGKGWGALHEVPRLTDVTAPLTSLSACAMRPDDVPELLARAFSIFASERPRPVHIAIPLDILAMPVQNTWRPVTPPKAPAASDSDIRRAVELFAGAKRPLIIAGGGAWRAAAEITGIAEKTGAAVIASTAGKGIVPDAHPLSLGGSMVRPESRDFIAKADVALAIGTELSETDSFIERLEINGQLIRIDIDPRKINDLYPADVGIIADAGDAASKFAAALPAPAKTASVENEISGVIDDISKNLTDSEKQHRYALEIIGEILPENGVVMGDICQLVYTGAFAFSARMPRQWHYPAGFCTLGCGLPNAIGAKLSLPERAVICLSGDGGFMFTAQELVTASELRLPIPAVVWNNGGLKQIQDDMRARNIDLVGVEGKNPDFMQLARSCGCHGVRAKDKDTFKAAVQSAFTADRPTLVEVRENDPWLVQQ